MSNPQIEKRIFVVEAGMKPQDVIKSNLATEQQKKLAHIFDTDGIEGYSQREANVFNATTITDNGNKGFTLWTTFADGSKKSETIGLDVAQDYKYSPDGEIAQTKMEITPRQLKEKNKNRGDIYFEHYPNGQLKREHYTFKDYPNPISTKEIIYNESGEILETTTCKEYWGSGDTETTKKTYQNGNLIKQDYTDHARWAGKSKTTNIVYDNKGDTLSYCYHDPSSFAQNSHTIEKYAGGRARVEKHIDHAPSPFPDDVRMKQTFDGKPVHSFEDLGKGYCRVISAEGVESYYDKDGIELDKPIQSVEDLDEGFYKITLKDGTETYYDKNNKVQSKEFVEKQTQGWFFDLVDYVKSLF